MKQFITLLLFLFPLAFFCIAHSQVNGYAKVTAIEDEWLTLSNADETYGTFTAGQQVIIMQMQDNVIGNNTEDNNEFGNLGSIRSAGLYEVMQVTSVSRAGGTLNSLRLNGIPGNRYRTNTNASVQIITFPKLGNHDYTTTGNLSALPWNGDVGGVLAFYVNGTLTLNHHINVNGKGFRGGTTNNGGSAECGGATRYRTAVNENYGNKGEGIYKNNNTNYAAGRGKIINGGGGGNSHNAGGGGGGNYTGGGAGGPGWICSPGMGGLGGISLHSAISSTRIFMGGGGGAGEANNDNPTQGGNGGGIIFIKASTVRTSGTGDTVRISSNGEKAINGANDGVGGAGAGGSVVFMVNSWSVPASKPILVTANGGDGGDIIHTDQHGGGGGGGQGVVINILSSFNSHIAATTMNGRGGLNNTNGTRADNGTGSDNAGVIGMPVLPIKLIYFTANLYNQQVNLKWKNEGINPSYFDIQRSHDGYNFTSIGHIAVGSNTMNNTGNYSFTDPHPLPQVSYYRLRIDEGINRNSFSKIITVRNDIATRTGIFIFPNPAENIANLHIYSHGKGTAFIEIINVEGIILNTKQYPVSTGANTIFLDEINKFKPGIYAVRVTINGSTYITRLIVP